MTLETLLVFTHKECPHSQALLEDFRLRGVVFMKIDVGEPGALERLRTLSWEHRLPVVADHERITIGFRGQASTFEALGLDEG
ncbi:MAG: hypothetical protein DRJ61_13405 [Acidobacteria bacterium]|nr:MAG: hypothetical protein DRJ61_13405 [Acidobacteriota bacterium]